MDEKHEVASGSLCMRADGILHIVFDFDAVPTPDLIAEYLAIRDELIGSSSPPVLVEIVRVPFVEREIRRGFMASLTPPPCRAVVVTDPTYSTSYKTFELVAEEAVPTRMFRSVGRAVEWIHEIVG